MRAKKKGDNSAKRNGQDAGEGCGGRWELCCLTTTEGVAAWEHEVIRKLARSLRYHRFPLHLFSLELGNVILPIGWLSAGWIQVTIMQVISAFYAAYHEFCYGLASELTQSRTGQVITWSLLTTLLKGKYTVIFIHKISSFNPKTNSTLLCSSM